MGTIHNQHQDITAAEEILVAGDTYSVGTYTGKGAAYNLGTGGTVSGDGTAENRILVSGNTASSSGGAIYSDGGRVDISYADFKNNRSGLQGGAIYAKYGSFTIDNATFENNWVNNDGGALFFQSNAPTITNTVFSGNTASLGEGGAIYVTSTTLRSTGNTYVGNRDNNQTGGAVFITGNAAMVSTGDIFNANYAKNGGAGISNAKNLTVNGSTFSANNAAEYGAAIRNSGTLTVQYSEGETSGDGALFINNTTGNNGGALYNTGTATVTGATFSGNSITGNFGGAIGNPGSITLTNSYFTGNYGKYGGVIYNTGTTTINGGVTFAGNTANYGGAIFHNGTATTTINGATFTGNRAFSSGGAIYIDDNKSMTINNVWFENNSCGTGGAITLRGGGTLTISGTAQFLTASDTVYAIGSVLFSEADVLLNASLLSGGGSYTVTDSTLAFGNTANISVADLAFSGTTNAITLKGTGSVGFASGENLSGVSVSVDTSDFSITNDSYTLATNFAGVALENITLTGEGKDYWLLELNGTTLSAKNNVSTWIYAPTETTTVTIGGTVFTGAYAGSEIPDTLLKNSAVTGFSSVGKKLTVGNGSDATLAGIKESTFADLTNRALSVTAKSTAVVEAALFDGVSSSENGGVIYNEGALSITGSTFSGNSTSSTFGGVIYNDDNKALTVTNSLFTGNYGKTFAGVLLFKTNAAHAAAAFTGNTFVNNRAGSHGGVLFNYNDDAVFTGNTFSANRAGTGGAIHNEANHKITLIDNIFDGNVANNAGAIHNDAGTTTLTVTGGTFVNNVATGSDTSSGGGAITNQSIANLTGGDNGLLFAGNTSAAYGGAIKNMGTLNVSGATFTGTKATYGTIWNKSGATVSVSGSTFTGNTAVTYGPALFNVGGATFTNVIASQNSSASGSVFFNEDGGVLNVSGGTYADNIATGTTNGVFFNHATVTVTGDALFTGNTGYMGSVLYNTKAAATFTMTGGTIGGNRSSFQGGAIYAKGAVNLTDVLLSGNSTMHDGGAIFLSGAGGTFTDAVFAGNTAKEGGAIFSNSALTISGGSFIENVAFAGGGGAGGAIYTDGTKLTIQKNGDVGTLFQGNRTTVSGKNGGAIRTGTATDLSIDGATFSGNYASGFGGALYNSGTATLTGVNFSGNSVSSDNYGGAIYNAGSLDVTGGTFESNFAQRGAALYNAGGKTASLDATVFSGNSATTNATINNDGTLTLTNVVADTNKGGTGGAISNKGTLTVSGGTFAGNIASHGGAIYQNGTLTSFTGATMSGNYASTAGGAIFAESASTLTGSGLVFDGNSSQNGGAYHTESTAGAQQISDSLFRNNFASSNGGAVDNQTTLTLENTTFSGNTAGNQGAAIYNGGTLTLTTAAFADNNANGYGGAIYNGGTLTGTGISISGGSAERGGAIYNTSQAQITGLLVEEVDTAYGAVTNVGGTMTLSGATFTDNRGNGFGGAIYNAAALDVQGATFSGGLALYGGAIFNAGTAMVTGATFTGNVAEYGAAIYNDDNKSITLTNVVFDGNSSSYGQRSFSGAIYNRKGGTITVTDSAFLGTDDSIQNMNATSQLIFNGSITMNSRVYGAGTISTGSNTTIAFGKSAFIVGDSFTNDYVLTVDSSALASSRMLISNYSGSGSYTLEQEYTDRRLEMRSGDLWLKVDGGESDTYCNLSWTQESCPATITVDGSTVNLYWGTNAFATADDAKNALADDGTLHLIGNGYTADDLDLGTASGYVGDSTISGITALKTSGTTEIESRSLMLENVTTSYDFTLGTDIDATGDASVKVKNSTIGRHLYSYKKVNKEDATGNIAGDLTFELSGSTVNDSFYAAGTALVAGTVTTDITNSVIVGAIGQDSFTGSGSTVTDTYGAMNTNVTNSTVGEIRGTGSTGSVHVGSVSINVSGSTVGNIYAVGGHTVDAENVAVSLTGSVVTGEINRVRSGKSYTGSVDLTLNGENRMGGTIAVDTITNNGTLIFDGALASTITYTDFAISGGTGTVEAVNGARLNTGNTRAYYYNVVNAGITGTQGEVIDVTVAGGSVSKAVFGENAFNNISAVSDGNIVVSGGSFTSNQFANGNSLEITGGSVGAKQYFAGGAETTSGADAFTGEVAVSGTAVTGRGILGGGKLTVQSSGESVTGGTTSVVVTSTGDETLTVERLAGGALITSVNGGEFSEARSAKITATFDSFLTITGDDANTTDIAVGGSIVSGTADFTQVGNSTLAVSGGTFSTLAGGSYIGYKLAGVTVTGDTGVILSGGTVTGNIFGGNVSFYNGVNDSLGVSNTSVTIDATNAVYFGSGANITAGNSTCETVNKVATQVITGDATVTLTGSAANMVGFTGTIWGDCGKASVYADGKWDDHVAGKSILVFNDFTGELNASRIACFDTYKTTGNTSVTIDSGTNINAKGVSSWEIEYSGQETAALTFDNSKISGNFEGDTITLTYDEGQSALKAGKSWVVMQSKQSSLFTNIDKASIWLFGEKATTTISDSADANNAGAIVWTTSEYQLTYARETESENNYFQLTVSKLA